MTEYPWEDPVETEPAAGQDPAAAGDDAGVGGAAAAPDDAAAEQPAAATPAAESVVSKPPATAPARRADSGARPLVRKEYYAISEVADLVGLPAHVLRYWESQFAVLNPSKNRSGNRVYQRKEIRLILLVKQLLHEEKYTVEGAKQKLEQLRRGGGLQGATAQALDSQLIQGLREDLLLLSELLSPGAD
jgi:DNA-binding transcriptional MerR regulator